MVFGRRRVPLGDGYDVLPDYWLALPRRRGCLSASALCRDTGVIWGALKRPYLPDVLMTCHHFIGVALWVSEVSEVVLVVVVVVAHLFFTAGLLFVSTAAV